MILKIYNYWVWICTTVLSDLLLLSIRLWLAKVFGGSGIVKLYSWDATIFLFEEEYNVPLIDPEIAAYIVTGFELLCPILLIGGAMTRLSVLPLIGITMVIQFTYLDLIDHYYWSFLCLILMCFGAGKFSVDYLINLYISRFRAIKTNQII